MITSRRHLVAGDTDDGRVGTIGSSEWTVVDVPSPPPTGRAYSGASNDKPSDSVNPNASSSDTDQVKDEDSPVIL